MWIKSLTRDTWVNVNHITHYDIRASKPPNVKGYCNVVAHLAENKLIEDQTYTTLFAFKKGRIPRNARQHRTR